jgi:peptide-methionine (S)-S-oxide reductase
LGCQRGVARTRVGYTGGTTVDPTYRRLGDHTESVQVDFDPTVVEYGELLELFWRSHDASRRAWSRQYMSAVFYVDEQQAQLASGVKELLEGTAGRKFRTEMLPLHHFYPAEDYHQKYTLQGDRLLNQEFRRMYPEFADFVDSPAAAKVNGYLYGCGSLEQVRTELSSLGLSTQGGEHLLSRIRGHRG